MSTDYEVPVDGDKDEHVYYEAQPVTSDRKDGAKGDTSVRLTKTFQHLALGLLIVIILLVMAILGVTLYKLLTPSDNECDKIKSGIVGIQQDQEQLFASGSQCKTRPCENGGTCVSEGNSQKCLCPAGFSGQNCSSVQAIIEDPPIDMKVKKGNDIFPECYARDALSYVWYVNGKPIGAYNIRTRFGTHGIGGTLQIDDVSDEHEGQYKCVARTKNGEAEHTFNITVVENCDVEFTVRPMSDTKRKGDNILIPCSAKHATSIVWKKAEHTGAPFNEIDMQPLSRFWKTRTNYLTIRNAVVEDAGIYRCYVEDEQGCSSHREAVLEILTSNFHNTYCGISRHDQVSFGSRIAGGTAARPGENPWHVSIRTTNLRYGIPKRQKTFCGGSLISKKYVLTSGHCVNTSIEGQSVNSELILGTVNCRNGSIKRHPKRVIVHPNFNQSAYMDSDLALIELDVPVEYNDDVRPICLDTATNIETVFFNDSPFGRIVGCGLMISSFSGSLAKKLQQARLPYVSDRECQGLVDDWNNDHPDIPMTKTENMACAGFQDKDRVDACAGDMGGSYIMQNSGQWFQVGILSWGPKCGTTDMVGFYTHVGRYYDWIVAETNFTRETCDMEICNWVE